MIMNDRTTSQDRLGKGRIWLMELRLPFLTATIVPIILGTTVAWAVSGVFLIDYFLLTLTAGMFLHFGANVSNDYFDHKSGTDDINVEFISPFSGGARMIQRGWLSPREVLAGSLVFFACGGIIGLYLTLMRGITILYLGIIGALSGFFYTAPPFKLVSRGIGEIFIGLNFGILMTLGSYYVQAQTIDLWPISASIPVSLLITAILYINEFPDYNADKAAGKKTLVVRLGLEKAAKGYAVLMMGVYVSLLALVVLFLIPFYALSALVTLPIAILATRNTMKNFSNSVALIPSYVGTIQVHLFTGLIMSGAYICTSLEISIELFAVYLLIVIVITYIVYRNIASIRVPV